MLYQKRRFTVPASAGNAAYCAEHGHTMPDVRGKCVRCGGKGRFAFSELPPPVNQIEYQRQKEQALRAKTRGIPCS